MDELGKAQLTEAEIRTRYVTPALSAAEWPLSAMREEFYYFSAGHDGGVVSASPLVAKIAEGMIGHSDPLAAQWLFRITFSLWYWPLQDKQTERELVMRFAAPSMTQGLRGSSNTPRHSQIA